MSELTSTSTHHSTHQSGAGRLLLWLALLLTVALLGFITYSAIRHNPIYSDRELNGISKYHFIESCKELAKDAEKLSVNAGVQAIGLKEFMQQVRPLAAGEKIQTSFEAESTAIVKATQVAPTGGGWVMAGLPVTLSIVTAGKANPLGQLPMQCAYSKADGKTTATLQLPNQ